LDEILDVFKNVRIFTVDDNIEKYDSTEKEMTKGINSHVKSQTDAEYGIDDKTSITSRYSYQPVYDKNMEVIDEIRWIVVKEEIGNSYREKFGTNINLQHFFHEINHAFAMQHPIYEKKGNKIYSKHGMFEMVEEITLEDKKFKINSVEQKNLIIEEAINEKITLDMLMILFKVNDYSEIMQKIIEMGNIPNAYNNTLVTLIKQFELTIGEESLMNWRIYNDSDVKEDFNKTIKKTDIACICFKDEDAYSYLSRKASEIFANALNYNSMSIQDYLNQDSLLLIDALAPLYAYKEGKGEKKFANLYLTIRNVKKSDNKETNPKTKHYNN